MQQIIIHAFTEEEMKERHRHVQILTPWDSLSDHLFCKPIGVAEPHVTLPYHQ